MQHPIDGRGGGYGVGEDALPLQPGQAGIPAKYLVDKLRELEDAV